MATWRNARALLCSRLSWSDVIDIADKKRVHNWAVCSRCINNSLWASRPRLRLRANLFICVALMQAEFIRPNALTVHVLYCTSALLYSILHYSTPLHYAFIPITPPHNCFLLDEGAGQAPRPYLPSHHITLTVCSGQSVGFRIRSINNR